MNYESTSLKICPLPSSFLLQSNVWKYYLTCLVFTSYNNAWWTGVEGVSQCLLISLMQAFNNQKMEGRKSCLRQIQFRKITWRQASDFLLVQNCLERFRTAEVGSLLASPKMPSVRPSSMCLFPYLRQKHCFCSCLQFRENSFLEERKPLLYKIGWKELVFRPNLGKKKLTRSSQTWRNEVVIQKDSKLFRYLGSYEAKCTCREINVIMKIYEHCQQLIDMEHKAQ